MMKEYVLITGATGGIGEELCRKFAENGYNILIHFKDNIKKAEEIKLSIGGKVDVKFIQLDLNNCEEIIPSLREWKKNNGNICGFISNAGIKNDELLIFMKDSDWQKVLNVNLNANFYILKCILPWMIKSKNGFIIFISSLGALKGLKGQSNYGASKAGILGLAKVLKNELIKKNIIVNTILPGLIDTDLTSEFQENINLGGHTIQKKGTPNQIAEIAFFLSNNNYINGQNIIADGGFSD